MKSLRVSIDSGAHSLYNKYTRGKERSFDFYESDEFWKFVDGYASFIKEHKDEISLYVSVDVIFNAPLSWKVQKYLEDTHKLNPLPVFHVGEDFKWLKKYIDNYDYIGLGGLGQTTSKTMWIKGMGDPAFSMICDDKGYPRVKTHGFAMTSPELIIDYPWASVDSVMGDSLILVREFGRIRVSTIEELYWTALGRMIVTSYGHVYKETFDLETFVTDDDGIGKWKKVNKVIRHEVGKKIYRVKSFGGRQVDLTADHGCFVAKGEGKCPVRANEIKIVEDRLISVCFRRQQENFLKSLSFEIERSTGFKSKSPKEKSTKVFLPFKVDFSETLMEFFGLWIADGSFSGDAVNLSCANDKECLDVIEKAIRMFDFGYEHKLSIKENGVDCGVSNAILQRAMVSLGFKKGAVNKEVPWWVFEISDNLICAFLRGYFSGDGSAGGGRTVSASTVSPKLFYGIVQLLNCLGIDPIWRIVRGKTGGFSNGKGVMFDINIGNYTGKKTFMNKIGFLQNKKNEDVNNYLNKDCSLMENKVESFFMKENDEYKLRCRKVENIGVYKGHVYDLEVIDGQRFVANGLLVHNSSSWVQFGKFGLIIIPKKRNGKFIYDESPHIISVSTRKKRKMESENFDHLPPIEKTHVLEYLEIKGFKMGSSDLEIIDFDKTKPLFPISDKEVSDKEVIVERGVCNDVYIRDALNLEYYLDLADNIPPYPRKWRRKIKTTQFPI